MPKPYSEDLRLKIIESYNKNKYSKREISKFFCVSHDFVEDMINLYTVIGCLKPKIRKGGNKSKINYDIEELIIQLINNKPSITLSELCIEVKNNKNIDVGLSVMHRAIKRLDLNKKKKGE